MNSKWVQDICHAVTWNAGKGSWHQLASAYFFFNMSCVSVVSWEDGLHCVKRSTPVHSILFWALMTLLAWQPHDCSKNVPSDHLSPCWGGTWCFVCQDNAVVMCQSLLLRIVCLSNVRYLNPPNLFCASAITPLCIYYEWKIILALMIPCVLNAALISPECSIWPKPTMVAS